jgi:DNA-binding response OmpR family regulator
MLENAGIGSALMKARILWIEGKRANSPSFVTALRNKDYTVEQVQTGGAALDCLVNFDPDLAVINTPSLRTSGKRICRELRERMPQLPIVIIIEAAQTFRGEICANVVLQLPFTPRKLLNRITPLLPGDEANLIHVGHIRLDLDRKKVRCQGRESRLTPRLAHLLHLLMLHAGEVIERGHLFREVWNTEYTGDTRTLDVHISWLRQALEENPRQPIFLKTIRGVGYRLDS